jgi:GAF domain-containing protein
MTTYDPSIHTLMTPVDLEAPRRMRRLRELDLGERPEPEFDQFAHRLAEMAGGAYAMVNFISEDRQYFAGLYARQAARAASAPRGDEDGEAGRVMLKTHGWCPHVVVRRLALVLDDVCAYPRFAANPVIGELGIRAYLGAPLIDRTDTTLGTICVVDTQQHQWGRPGLELIKSMAAEMVERIHRREAQRQ